MVKELNLAMEIILDSRRDFMIDNQINVASKDVENGIRQLMESDNLIRKRVKEMTERSRMALMDGGSSHFSLGQLIDDVIDNMPRANCTLRCVCVFLRHLKKRKFLNHFISFIFGEIKLFILNYHFDFNYT